jgi:hypothetical protein
VAALSAVLLGGGLAAGLGRARAVAELGPRLAHQARLADDLARAIERAGGHDAVLRCGRPAVGRYRGTLLAWHLGVPKRVVRADGGPDAVTFRSRLAPGARPSPSPLPPLVVEEGEWQVGARCRALRAAAAPA